MTGLIRRDLTSAFKLLRDRSDHQNTDYYRDPDEKEQLIEASEESPKNVKETDPPGCAQPLQPEPQREGQTDHLGIVPALPVPTLEDLPWLLELRAGVGR